MRITLSIILSLVCLQAIATESQEEQILEYMAHTKNIEFRSIDGKGTNLFSRDAGTPGSLFNRMTYADYQDGISAPNERTKINPREVSTKFFQSEETQNYKNASDFLWLWGQFMDHDLTLTDVNPEEAFPIAVPQCDAFFDISCTGTNEMVFTRSESVLRAGIREQINRTTSYIDGSMVYGENQERADTLRTNDGTGKMILDEKGYLPKNHWGLKNLPSESPHFFVAGDIRANDHIGLMAMHNLWVREHNYWATKLAETNSELEGDELYQKARAIVIAEIQNITFAEFLPILVGVYSPSPDSLHSDYLESTIFNEFSTAAFRMGHTLVSGEFFLENIQGKGFSVLLRDSFFNPSEYQRAGLDSIMIGFSKHRAQARDPLMNTELQNFLMVFPEEGIFDLFSFNLQRGREHGIPSYNELRREMGFSPIRNFAEISREGSFNRALASVYKNVDEIDPWLGLIAEKAANQALLGPTASAIIAKQFRHLRDSDRFWFTHAYPQEFVEGIKTQTLGDVILRNTNATLDHIDKNVFLVE